MITIKKKTLVIFSIILFVTIIIFFKEGYALAAGLNTHIESQGRLEIEDSSGGVL